jgi:undecaprenyl-phosphate 4-deoxy-4-formamido-L-arabinose transferase
MYSVIIPVFHGEATIERLHAEIRSFFALSGQSFEVVWIYDCGPDNSWEVIKKLKTAFPDQTTAVRLSRNFGQHNALICGFLHARGDYFITMDEDLQHHPADIQYLVQEQQRGDFDVVYGKFQQLRHSWFRRITSKLLQQLLKTGIPGLHEDFSAFRLIRRSVALRTVEMRNSYTFLDGYLAWITMHVSSVSVSHANRVAGKSSYNLKKLVEHSVNIFVTFSNLPIRMLTYGSVLIFVLSAMYSVYIVIRKLVYDDLITGFATLAIFLGMGFGLVLLGLGIVGEYIYRINLKTTQRPNFVEAEIL